jgi:hypothetical protein
MNPVLFARHRSAYAAPLSSFAAAIALVAISGCGGASYSSSSPMVATPSTFMSSGAGVGSLPLMAPLPINAPSPDPRVGLRGGQLDSSGKRWVQPAAEAIWNMRMVSHTDPSPKMVGVTNSDLGFSGKNVIQGNYNGFQIWNIEDPSHPALRIETLCPASQSDVSVYKNLLFVSAEAPSARLDCGTQGVRDTVSKERIRGIRIYDISDISKPKYLTNVQSCRGSHTHTVVNDPNDPENIYIYISGTSGVRSPNELPGCLALPGDDPNSALFRIEVVKVPLKHPENAAIVNGARIFAEGNNAGGLASPRGHGAPPPDTSAEGRAAAANGRGGRGGGAQPVAFGRTVNGQDILTTIPGLAATATKADSQRFQRSSDSLISLGYARAPGNAGRGGGNRGGGAPNPGAGKLTQCHDITVYPAAGLAGGACAGMGLLLDISNAANPRRIDAVADSNFSFWHSATFSNDGSKVLFSDEWGGGGAAYCRATDPKEWGADALFSIVNGKMVFKSYYKMPAAQSPFENCVAHNGSLIPIPGRDVMVQAFYQGGITVFDWTDIAHPKEIAFFDRGPNQAGRAVGGGFWSAYWYNGLIIGSEEKRGLDIFELTPSAALSQNEIDAAKTVQMEFMNVQDQPKFVWPTTFVLARAYVDQLDRNRGMSPAGITTARTSLAAAEAASGGNRKAALVKLAADLQSLSSSASDRARVQRLIGIVNDLAK